MTLTRYPILPDVDTPLTDWYAGAHLAGGSQYNINDWEGGDALVAFGDIGRSEGQAQGQVVIYFVDAHRQLFACSAEIDANDAIAIAKALNKWAREVRRGEA